MTTKSSSRRGGSRRPGPPPSWPRPRRTHPAAPSSSWSSSPPSVSSSASPGSRSPPPPSANPRASSPSSAAAAPRTPSAPSDPSPSPPPAGPRRAWRRGPGWLGSLGSSQGSLPPIVGLRFGIPGSLVILTPCLGEICFWSDRLCLFTRYLSCDLEFWADRPPGLHVVKDWVFWGLRIFYDLESWADGILDLNVDQEKKV